MDFPGFRKDGLDVLFERSGMREAEKLNHTPFIVVFPEELKIVKSIRQLITEYNDPCPVIFQWPGKQRSDFFQFTVGDLRKWISYHPKKGRQVI
jgi:hypothetical protein